VCISACHTASSWLRRRLCGTSERAREILKCERAATASHFLPLSLLIPPFFILSDLSVPEWFFFVVADALPSTLLS
jgi:hypothetical protein